MLGTLDVNIQIDSVGGKIEFKAVGGLEQKVILGMTFCKDFDFEMSVGRGVWRIQGEEWHSVTTLGKRGGKRKNYLCGMCH